MKGIWIFLPVMLAYVLSACSEDEVGYYPVSKKHLGETYTSYSINNISWLDESTRIVVLNFYPEEVTSLSYVTYNESTCAFTFGRGETAHYRIVWEYDTDSDYVEVQYGQNAMWYTINDQQHKGEYVLTANDGMTVRMFMRTGGSMFIENGETFYEANLTVTKFSIEEVDEEE